MQRITTAKPVDQGSQAVQAQAQGYHNLLSLSDCIQCADRTTSAISILPHCSNPQSLPLNRPSNEQITLDLLGIVWAEIAKYEALGVFNPDAQDDYDVIKECHAHHDAFPPIHDPAMDILPAQAMSASSEGVFSSIKFTCTQEQGRISISTVETLQVLKHSIKWHHTLDFTSHITDPGDDVIK
ncbi:hypothetical protein FRC11_008085 [Ceratobasidium sp. 423]|nr:hypothetical protein FRC11_008085 [Ceratobasidium sp. 423]